MKTQSTSTLTITFLKIQAFLININNALFLSEEFSQNNVYGFGAKIDQNVSHCFPLTFDPKNPCVKGLNGIIDAYSKSFEKVKLYGPSYISPMIRMATNAAVQNWEKSHAYTVLFIITDNEVMDIITAKDCVVEASDKPLSIIIIGIGKGDFYKLEELDADEHDIKSENGVRMKRDIVQFVRLRKFRECSIQDLS